MMNRLFEMTDGLYHSLAEPLSWVLIHFLWQGALGAALLAGALYLLRNHSSRVRYAVSLAALVGLLMLPAVTWWALPAASANGGEAATVHVRPIVTTMAAPAAAVSSEPAPSAASWAAQVGNRWTEIAPWVVGLWMLGVLVCSARMLGGWVYTRRLRRQAQPLSDAWRERIDALAARVGVQRPVDARQSSRVEVPMVAGWWQPVILIPVGFLTGMAPAQVEAIVAHELAHIRRHDVLVGWIQAVAETLLFYHPAVWWVSRQVRIEREHCCDDVAVAVSASRVTYARALTTLEERRQPRPSLALAANDGSLLHRIRRLVERNQPVSTNERATGAVASMLVAGGLLITGACATSQSPAEAQPAARYEPDPAMMAVPSDTNEVTQSRRVYVVQDSAGEATVKVWTDSTDGRAPRIAFGKRGGFAWTFPDTLEDGMRAFTFSVDTLITGFNDIPMPPDAPFPPEVFRFEMDGEAPRVFMFNGDSLRVPSPPPIPDFPHLKLDSLRHFRDGGVHFFRTDSLSTIHADSLREKIERSMRIYRHEMKAHEEEWNKRREELQREMEQHPKELRRHMEERQVEIEREINRELPKHLREQAEELRRQAERLEEQAREMEARRDTSGTGSE